MNLARAELRRLFKRRFTRWMLVLVVLVLAGIVASIAATNQQPGPEVRAEALAQAQRDYDERQRWIEQDIRNCEEAQESDDPEAAHWPQDCERIREQQPSPEEMAEWNMPPSFDFRNQFGEMVTAFAGVLALFAFIVGASFVGAEWRTGGMTNLLLWRPRRLHVLGTKLGTLLAAVGGLVVLLGGAFTGAFWLVARYRGITDNMTSGAWQSFGLTGLRALAIILVAGALGFAAASIGRHTAAALGTAIAAFVVGVVGVSVVAYPAGVRFPEAWLWPTYIRAWLSKSVELTDWNSCEMQAGACVPQQLEITWQVAGAGIGGVLVLALAVAMWHMRQRDIA